MESDGRMHARTHGRTKLVVKSLSRLKRVAFATENAGITDVSSISIFVSSIFISPFLDNQPPTPASVNRK